MIFFRAKNPFKGDCSSEHGFIVSKLCLAVHKTVSNMRIYYRSRYTYSSNGMSNKSRGTHAKRPTFLSSGIDSPCKGLISASAALQNDQEWFVPSSYAEISIHISFVHIPLGSLNTSTKECLHWSPEIEGYSLRSNSSHPCRGCSSSGITFIVFSRTVWYIRSRICV